MVRCTPKVPKGQAVGMHNVAKDDAGKADAGNAEADFFASISLLLNMHWLQVYKRLQDAYPECCVAGTVFRAGF